MKLQTSDLQSLCTLAEKAAKEAGTFIQEMVSTNFSVTIKKGQHSIASQVVTEVDLAAQEIILNKLSHSITEYDLGLLTEESVDNESRLKKEYFWCIDPLDGTLPFTERREGFAVSIALVSKEGIPYIGVIYDPVQKNLYSATKDKGVLKNGSPFTPIHQDIFNFVSDHSLHTSISYTSLLEELQSTTPVTERPESFGAVKSALLVAESGGIFCKPPKREDGCGSIWDYAATTCIFQELCFYATAFDGTPLLLNDPQTTFMNKQGVIFSTKPISFPDYTL